MAREATHRILGLMTGGKERGAHQMNYLFVTQNTHMDTSFIQWGTWHQCIMYEKYYKLTVNTSDRDRSLQCDMT